ncbi:hypothetical protein Pcinc_015958 [Petrolisthes cinctipes]|uniref:Ig-like domain-containing protein n=1 Tax=Petrolisthes cinctipes TaxID=88211 RepID=A0AAE1KMJ1_PETCI|nr:hypothetical protein Pcinc_015958 [Petrolisthes cinctipes]
MKTTLGRRTAVRICVLQVSGRDGRVVSVLGVGVGASDVYRCELVAEGPPFHTTQRSANMTVVVAPKGPPIITGGEGHYSLNQLLHLNCTAPPARPAPTLTWTLNGNKAPAGSVWATDTTTTTTTTTTGLEMAVSRLSVRVARRNFHQGVMTIVCKATLGSLYTRSHLVTLPEPSATWYSSLNLYHASGSVRSFSSMALEVVTSILGALLAHRILS